MKKTLLTITLLVFTVIAFGQQISVGIRGGVDLAAIQSSSSITSETNTTGTHLAATFSAFADVKYHNVSVQPAIIFTGKGGNVATGDGGTGDFALRYVEVPINFVYNFPIVVGHIYLGAGPYLAFGSGGTLSINGPGGIDSESIVYGGSGDFTKTDSGFDFIGGVQFKSGFLVHLNYDLGVANILNQQGPEAGLGSFKTRTFGICVGFTF